MLNLSTASRIPARARRFTTGLCVTALGLASAIAIPWAPESAKPEREFNEVPAEKFVENLPASLELQQAPTPRSVPAAMGEKDAPEGGPIWRFRGPAPIPNGQTQRRSDSVSGRVTSIAVHPTNPDIAYVGTAQGGLYRTLNGGASWTQMMDNAFAPVYATPLAIGAVTIDPSDSTRVFVGTGEGNLSGDSYFGSGFYIITAADSGNPVVNGPYNAASGNDPLGGVPAGADVFTGRSIVAIAVDSTNSNNIFVSTSSGVAGLRPSAYSVLPRRGLYRTTNGLSGGPAWTRLQITGTTNNNTISTSCVLEPGNPNNLVVSYYGQSAADPSGIYRTTNALAPTPTFTLSQAIANLINSKLAISKQGANVTVYATADISQGTIFKSTDGGATFVNRPGANNFAGGQGFYDIAVGVDPNNANVISVGGQAGDKIFRRSTDGATTFTFDTDLTPITAGLHADVHAITYAPSNGNIVYHGNDGGIWRSTDGGNNWTSLNTAGFSATQFSGIALHPTDANFTLGGTQDNGSELLKPDGSIVRVDFGDGGFSLIDQNATDTTTVTMYHTYFNQRNSLLGTGRVLNVPCAVEGQWAFRGVFAGVADPTPVCDGSPGDVLNGIALTDAVNFYAPMVLGPGNPNTWYFGSDKLYRSPNRADTATAVSQLLDQTTTGTPPTGTPVSSIAISRQDDNVRIVGLNNNGKIYATTTGAPVMLQIAGNGATNGTGTTPATGVHSIAIDPNNKNVAYFAFGGFGTPGGPISHIYKVTNLNALSLSPPGNVVFTPVSNGVPDLPANALAIDPQSGSSTRDSSDIYVGTDNGVYKTNNAGASWGVYGASLPHSSVFGLAIQNPSRIIRAATHGRGWYDIGIVASAPAAPLLVSALSRKTHTGAGTFDINLPLAGGVGIEDRAGSSNLNTGGNFTIVLRFTNDVVSGGASVTNGTGSVAPGGVTFAGRDMIVNLTGVTNVQTLSLRVVNVTDTNGNSLAAATVNIGFLMGDVNGDGTVNSADVAIVRNVSGQSADASNFRSDINTDGPINSADAAIVRARTGTMLPP